MSTQQLNPLNDLVFWFVRFLKDQPMLEETPPVVQNAYRMINKHDYSQEELKMIDRVMEQELLAQEIVLSAEERGEARGEDKKELELIINMIKKGLSLDLVSDVTNQSEDKIIQIAETHGLSFQ